MQDFIRAAGDYIIFIGGVLGAIIAIVNFFAKPTSALKRKKNNEFREQMTKSLNEILPSILQKHDLETRDRYRSDRQRYLNEIKGQVLEETKGILQEIREINLKQSESLTKMNEGLKDVLRQKIMAIYYEYRDTQCIPVSKKEALDELYKDYKTQGGNSYIDKYYGRIKEWKIIYEREDYECR